MLLPSRPLGLRKVGPVMRADAVLAPKRRFRNALRHMHHIFHFQRCTLRKRLSDQLCPPRKLCAGSNERLPGSDHSYLPPHHPAKRAAQLFSIVQRAVLLML